MISKLHEGPSKALPADSYSPSEAVALAIADHRAGSMTDWPFVDALNKAKDRLDAYPRLVEAIRSALRSQNENGHIGAGTHDDMENLLRELGEL